jgi:bifunctional DNA-binding transcriptional regulator/antitoxin component of YhaV-PrlF toxin-antitoxin module
VPVRKEIGLDQGSNLDLTVDDGGRITLHPVVIYRTLRLSEQGQAKLNAARDSGTGKLPGWLQQEIADAESGSNE